MENTERKVKLITDSGCDIPEGWEHKHDIDIMPFGIMVDGEEHWERTGIKPEEFYEMQARATEIPKTSQIIPIRFEEKFLECVEEGYDEVIVVLINSITSKTYQNAVQARDMLIEDGRLGKTEIHVVDSHCYSSGYGYPVVEAAKKIKAGQSVKKILDYLEDWFASVEIYLVALDLKYLRKSGRCSAVAGFVGELMGIKPIIAVQGDETKVVKKARGEKNIVSELLAIVKQRRIPETPWILVRATCTEIENFAMQELIKLTGTQPVMASYAGAAVGANAGPKIFGVIFKGKKRI